MKQPRSGPHPESRLVSIYQSHTARQGRGPAWLLLHSLETFKLSNGPDFVAKVRDLVGLYFALPAQSYGRKLVTG